MADSQADHCSLGTPAEADEGSNLDQAVALSTDTPINDTGAIATNESEICTLLRGIIWLLLLMTVVVIFVRHEDN